MPTAFSAAAPPTDPAGRHDDLATVGVGVLALGGLVLGRRRARVRS